MALIKGQRSLSRAQQLNRFLLAGCLIAFMHLMAGFWRPDRRIVRSLTLTATSEAPAKRSVISLSELTRRNLFQPLFTPPPVVPHPVEIRPPPPPPAPKIPLSQKASRLRLVGIINGDPRQVIIEDQAAQKTVYLTDGQTINDMQVKKIYSDHITLMSDGDQMDLSL